VRRSSDNTEQDFSATQITDGTLTTFTGANDGFVTTWYDQSGNSNNAVQATAANQPKLVSSGVVELDNGKPCVVWDNANDTMTINTSYNSSNLLSIFSVYNKTTPIGGGDSVYLVIADNSISVPDGVLAWRDANKIGTYRSGGFSFGSILYNLQVTSSFIYTLSQVDFYNNNLLVGSTTNSNAISNFDYTSIQIGRTGGGNAFKNQELIIYPSDQSANRNDIETNINTNYVIFPETGLLADYPNASVAYSLRNLSNITTNVVRVRRSSDNTEQNFTSTEITDGTLTTFTGTNDGFVTIWYDQSRYSNDATQSTASEQPKLVTNGVVELDNGKPCLRYDTTGNDSFNLTTRLTNARSTFSVVNFVYNSGDLTQYLFGDNSSFDYVSGNNTLLSSEFAASFVKLGDNKVNNISSDFTTTARPLVQSLVSMIHTSSTGEISRISKDRSEVPSRSLQGKLQEIIIYSTDQSSNRTGIEANINNEYDIYEAQGLLADYPDASAAYSLRNLIDTTTNVVRVRRSSDNAEQDFTATQITDGTLTSFTGANDGYVTIWYDQSGNSNNASQTAAANQPKLVSSGVVELDNGKPCLNYDNTGNDNFDLATTLTDVRSVFQVWNAEQNFGANTQFILGSNNRYDYHSGSGAANFILSSSASGFVKGGANYINSVAKNFLEFPKPLTQCLVSMISLQSDGRVNQLTKDRTISGRSWRGKMTEIILYNIDQTSNRVAIDANIMSYYEDLGSVSFGEAVENSNLTLIAPLGKVFATVEFASYGNPSGTNGNYTIGSCNASSSQTIVEGYLLGNTGEITIPATNAVFGDPCSGTAKKLAVKVTFN
jgi:viroplasmin and RNaseH domain-containing protein